MDRVNLGIVASPERLRENVETLCRDYAPRDTGHPQNLERAAEWIEAQLRMAGLSTRFQEYRAGSRTYRNVIARRPGNDPERGAVVVGAHYDAVAGSPGADDNASGVAVLLELARTLPRGAPRSTQYFVAFCTEEAPFFGGDEMGSHVFARSLLAEGQRVDLMISLDLVGYYSDEPGSQRFPFPGLQLLYPRRGNFIAIIGDLRSGPWIDRVKRGMLLAGSPLPVHSFRASPRWAPTDLSDHRSFRSLGLPGVQVSDTAFMRYPQYHQPEDTPDRLDYRRMAALVLALHGALFEYRPPPPPPA